MIPKIIHYCWFGKSDKDKVSRECMKTWKKLSELGYKVYEWNEDNFDIESNELIRIAYQQKKYAFVSDYVRIWVLYNYGGIYLDTDVEIFKNFDEFLNYDLFLGMIFNCSIGTAVIGAKKNNHIMEDMLDIYKRCKVNIKDSKFEIQFEDFVDYPTHNNNDLFTIYFVTKVSGFLLNNKFKCINNIAIFPKEYFEKYTFSKKKNYCVHHANGSWYKSEGESRKKSAIIVNKILGNVFYDKLRCMLKMKKLPYYYLYNKKLKSKI